MTEAEWLACNDPPKLLKVLSAKRASQRKRRLFGVACCRRVWHLIPDDRSRAAVLIAERFADGLADEATLKSARREANMAHLQFERPPWFEHAVTGACVYVAEKSARNVPKNCWHCVACCVQMKRIADSPDQMRTQSSQMEVWNKETACLCDLIRDLFGPVPKSGVLLSSAWITSTVERLSKSIYEESTFERLPILADALEEGGCTDEAILAHCRGPGPHVRGCWVVDLLLGKE